MHGKVSIASVFISGVFPLLNFCKDAWKFWRSFLEFKFPFVSLSALNCSKLTIETSEQGVYYVQNYKNKDTRTCIYYYFWTFFTTCFSVSVVNFEHVIVGWVICFGENENLKIDSPNWLESLWTHFTRVFHLSRRRSGVFIVNFEHISRLFLPFLWLTLNK